MFLTQPPISGNGKLPAINGNPSAVGTPRGGPAQAATAKKSAVPVLSEAEKSERRVNAVAAMNSSLISKNVEAEQSAFRHALRMETKAEIARREEMVRQADLRQARAVLGHLGSAPASPRTGGGKSKRPSPRSTAVEVPSPALVTEAIRDMNLDCVRHEERVRLEELAHRQQEAAERLARSTDQMKMDQVTRHAAARKQAEEALQRKRELEESRSAAVKSSADEMAAMKAHLQKEQKKAQDALLQTIKERRDAKEKKKEADKEEAERQAIAREAAFAKRRRVKEEEKAKATLERGETKFACYERVALEREKQLKRCEAELMKLKAEKELAQAQAAGAGGDEGGGGGGGAGGKLGKSTRMQQERIDRQLARLKSVQAATKYNFEHFDVGACEVKLPAEDR